METSKVKNIVISGTNMWNPGDDFVRDGVIRILGELFKGCQLNFLFYNFNQDFFPQSKFSGITNMVCKGDLNLYRDHVDAVVIAGLSAGKEIKDLYNWVIENNLQDRVYLIGAGYENTYVDKFIYQEPEATIFKNAKIIIGRTKKTPKFIPDLGLPFHHINCPALLSVKEVKQIPLGKTIERIGFSIQLPHEIGVSNHCCTQAMFDMTFKILAFLSTRYKVEVVAHHKSEYFYFLNLLKNRKDIPVIFSSFYHDLFSIYPKYDLLITTRLHSSLFANGHGIPGIIINDTDRHTHCLEGFPHSVWVNSIESFTEEFNRAAKLDLQQIAREAVVFKRELVNKYLDVLREPFGVEKEISSAENTPGTVSAGEKPANNNSLPVHFVTIVLNGEPFIRQHLESFKSLPFTWHWHIIEGVADLKNDTSWSLKNGARITDEMHCNGISNDGTCDYLDEIARSCPENVTLYRKPSGAFWDGKLEMVNAPLKNITDECLLWQIDSDEIWTAEQISTARSMFTEDPTRTAAYYRCRFFVGDGLVVTTRDTYGNHAYEWLRTWRYKPGDRWATHEPPRLCRQVQAGQWVDIASINPIIHETTEANGLVFDHYAYVTEAQLKFKELYYGYAHAVDSWKKLQSAESFPVRLGDYFPWVKDDALVDCISRPLTIHGDIKKILWVRTDSIGDNVLAMSMLPHIKTKFPDAEITVVCKEHIAELYDVWPIVHRVITYNKTLFQENNEYRSTLLSQLQGLQSDLCLNSVYSREPVTDMLVAECGARERIALECDRSNYFNQARKAVGDMNYTKLIPAKPDILPELDRHREFLLGIGIDPPPLAPAVWTTPDDADYARNFFTSNKLKQKTTIAIMPAAQWAIKQYSYFGEALAKLCRQKKFTVIGLGGVDDAVFTQQQLDILGVPAINLCGQLTLRQSAEILRLCRLAVGVDSSLAHISCAVGTPNVIILGGGHFGRFMPYSPLTSVACLPLDCYGCNWKCAYDQPYCIQSIAPEVVQKAVKESLTNASSKPRIYAQLGTGWEASQTKPAYLESVLGCIKIPVETHIHKLPLKRSKKC